MSGPTLLLKMVLAFCLLASAASALQAQEKIKWRTDYNAARKEAEAKNLPLLIDFITYSCIYCDKMDNTTFVDPRVIGTSNERFVPLKINHATDKTLGEHLNISLFPTIVVASPDGRVIDKKVGYQDGDAMSELLQRTLASLTPTDAMQDKYAAAIKYEAAGDYGRAISNLRDILDGKPRPISKNAQELLLRIGKRAEDRLSLAKEMQNKGQSAAALEEYAEVARSFPGIPAESEAKDQINRLAQAKPDLTGALRTKKARDLMNQAKQFYKSEDYIPCVYFCDKIVQNYGDLPEGPEAHALAGTIKNNREWMQRATGVMTDHLGGMLLALADNHLKAGEVRLAQQFLQRVITQFPGTRLAESAQIRLNQLQGTVPIRADVARP